MFDETDPRFGVCAEVPEEATVHPVRRRYVPPHAPTVDCQARDDAFEAMMDAMGVPPYGDSSGLRGCIRNNPGNYFGRMR
jgi:hypothetical protein